MKRVMSGSWGLAAALVALALAARGADAAELVLFEARGCPWCARFDAEIGPVYAATAEGRRAPLRRIEHTPDPPEGIVLAGPIRYTPTFVLVEGGREVGRIQGYPGADFFWGLLNALLERLPAPRAAGSGED
ncbi:MAG: transcriptional regulator [Geminicoccaceae bacterium]|nr:transcriptional regulator [Geminicoccaceae bacterium]MCS7268070.1 transcriptional regulator [Geminicoccaceae bacterium]MDW8342360.1 transcriptional regulator [Geminicoccaceae bacterium]